QDQAAAWFHNENDQRDIGVFVMVAPGDIYFSYMESYDEWAKSVMDSGQYSETSQVDAPNFTWAGRSTHQNGNESIDYMLFAGDRALHITLSNRSDWSGQRMELDSSAGTTLADGILNVLCG
ncbi:hypothetical protein JS562_54445, partial [Agrobacterium sp. S2]|nr:hypothetical protein [Agrobacterium sp. S2]